VEDEGEDERVMDGIVDGGLDTTSMIGLDDGTMVSSLDGIVDGRIDGRFVG